MRLQQNKHPYYLAGKPVAPNHDLAVRDKYTGEVIASVAKAGPAELEQAIAAAAEAATPLRKLPTYQRRAALDHLVNRCQERSEELAETLCLEAGKPISDARGEVSRLVETLRVSAEESVRIYGEVLPLDITPAGRGYRGQWKRVPVGPCAFITPFNFPLNLVAHKIGPALACGCPFVLKPASATPLGALLLGEMLAELDLPPGTFSILPISGSDSGSLVEDPRIKKLSFTGSAEVGWELKRRAGKKLVTLELGGNAAAVIHEDADLDDAVSRLIRGVFYQSGQSCISVQRIYVHQPVYEQLRDKLLTATGNIVCGDPRDENTLVGPLITEEDAQRVVDWVQQAVERGARLLCGGSRQGSVVEPTLLENVPADAQLSCEEAFGPVAVLYPYKDFEEALREVNDSDFGLQAGLFTRDLYRAYAAWDELDVGGVLINDVPSWRIDHMPYGGVKDSGLGREGIRWAIESMTEVRLLAIRQPGS